jgi:hypothetical protein
VYPASQKYKDGIYATSRMNKGRVTFDVSDVTAAGDVSTITVANESALSVKTQLIDKQRTSTYKLATNEQDRFSLDGTWSFADDTLANNGEIGWASSVISDSAGLFLETADFAGKIGGSQVVNPHIMKYASAGTPSTTLVTPTAATTVSLSQQAFYDGVETLSDGSTFMFSRLTSGEMAQTIFSFDLISLVERKYGISIGATTAAKVAWLKANVASVRLNWYGYGIVPSGNKATVNLWNNDAPSWTYYAAATSTASTPTLATKFTANAAPAIDASGFVHFIAYADASNGTLQSAINTDYVELEVGLPPSISFSFTGNHSSVGLTISFDTLNNEYATDFTMTAYDSNNVVLATYPYTGNTFAQVAAYGQLTNYRRVDVVITKWSVPNRRARVAEVDFGVVKVYTGEQGLVSMQLTEEMDLTSGELPSPEFQFTVDNSSREFNILNPTGFYKSLQQKQQVISEIGLTYDDGTIEWIPVGNYFLWEWQSDEGSLTSTFFARTGLDLMANVSYENLTPVTKSLYQLAVDVFTLCGITNYSIDTALQSINTNCLVEKTNCKSVLQMIALAGCANIYVTRGNVITVKAVPALTTAVDTISMNDQYAEPRIILDKAVKQVDVSYFTDLNTSVVSSVVAAGVDLGDTFKLDGNTLINTSTRAIIVGNWILAQKNNRAVYTINWRGNQAQELADVVGIGNSYGTDMKAYITKTELKYEGYVQATTEARGVPN